MFESGPSPRGRSGENVGTSKKVSMGFYVGCNTYTVLVIRIDQLKLKEMRLIEISGNDFWISKWKNRGCLTIEDVQFSLLIFPRLCILNHHSMVTIQYILGNTQCYIQAM